MIMIIIRSIIIILLSLLLTVCLFIRICCGQCRAVFVVVWVRAVRRERIGEDCRHWSRLTSHCSNHLPAVQSTGLLPPVQHRTLWRQTFQHST